MAEDTPTATPMPLEPQMIEVMTVKSAVKSNTPAHVLAAMAPVSTQFASMCRCPHQKQRPARYLPIPNAPIAMRQRALITGIGAVLNATKICPI